MVSERRPSYGLLHPSAKGRIQWGILPATAFQQPRGGKEVLRRKLECHSRRKRGDLVSRQADVVLLGTILQAAHAAAQTQEEQKDKRG